MKISRNNTNFAVQLFEHFKSAKWGDEYSFLKYYQNIARSYITIATDSRGLLIAHAMGLGKSILAVSIAMDLMRERQPIVLLTKSLQENMHSSIHKYVTMRAAVDDDFPLGKLSAEELNKWIAKNYSFVSMNASNMLKQLSRAAEGKAADELNIIMEKKFGAIAKTTSLSGKLLIVDEAHNLFRAITNGSKNALGLYDLVMQAKDLKVIFLTGTPVANDPFELVPCFNMLHGGEPLFPEHYQEFNKLFVDEKHGRIKNKERFQNRIFGMVSYVDHKSRPGAAFNIIDTSTAAEFPKELPIIVERVNMDPDQYVAYQLARDKEKEEGSGSFGSSAPPGALTKPKGKAASTYRVKSRQLGNFAPPMTMADIKDPKMFPVESLASAKYRQILANIARHENQIGLVYSQFTGVGGLGTFSAYLDSLGWECVNKKIHGVKKDNNVVIDVSDEVDGNAVDDEVDNVAGGTPDTITFSYVVDIDTITAINPNHKYTFIDITFPKYMLVANVAGSPVGYFSLIGENSGVRILSSYFSNCDLVPIIDIENRIRELINESRAEHRIGAERVGAERVGAEYRVGASEVPRKTKKYAIISGEVTIEERAELQNIYNSDENKYGGVIDLMLISSTGAEGLDLKNGRHLHIMEMYWNWSRIAQIIARLVRTNSHISLLEDEKTVQPYIYLAIPPKTESDHDVYPVTTDVELYDDAIANQLTIDSFITTLHDVAIECMVNAEDNCRVCNPTNTPLFTNNIVADIRNVDPCTAYSEVKIMAAEVEFEGEKYYYSSDPSSIYEYRIYSYDKNINGYRPMKESDPRYEKIIMVL